MLLRSYEDLTVILPTYNEGGNIRSMLEALIALYPGSRSSSPMTTPPMVRPRPCARSRRSIRRPCSSPVPPGQGLTASIMDGIMACRTERFVVMDADFQHPPESVGGLYDLLERGADVAVGKRVNKNSLSLSRTLASWGANAWPKRTCS